MPLLGPLGRAGLGRLPWAGGGREWQGLLPIKAQTQRSASKLLLSEEFANCQHAEANKLVMTGAKGPICQLSFSPLT